MFEKSLPSLEGVVEGEIVRGWPILGVCIKIDISFEKMHRQYISRAGILSKLYSTPQSKMC